MANYHLHSNYYYHNSISKKQKSNHKETRSIVVYTFPFLLKGKFNFNYILKINSYYHAKLIKVNRFVDIKHSTHLEKIKCEVEFDSSVPKRLRRNKFWYYSTNGVLKPILRLFEIKFPL